MRKIWMLCSIILSGIQPLLADKAPGTIDEFTKVEEHYRNPPASDDSKKKILEKNLVSAIRISLIKKYTDHEAVTKDLNPSTVSYEMAPGTFNCYVKYKQFHIFLMFAIDPTLYLQTPIEERFYIKPDSVNLNASNDPAHQNDSKSKPDSKTPDTESKK